MSDSPFKPMHTAEEMAEFLRQEIKHRDENLIGLGERRKRVSMRFESELDEASSIEEALGIRERRGRTVQEMIVERKRLEDERFALRQTLQYLTGELWA